ncbi:MAG: ABC transporter permease, partial [Gemmatimonadota bacterium]
SPPRLVQALTAAFLPAGAARDGVLGDLYELYAERRAASGRLVSDVWYVYEAISAAIRYAAERLARRERRHRGRHTPGAGRGAGRGPWRRRSGLLESTAQDLRYGFRVLKNSPGFTLVAAITLALGIGATTTIFSLINSVLLKPAPGMRNSAELVKVRTVTEEGRLEDDMSWPNFLAYRSATDGAAELAGMSLATVSVGGVDQAGVTVGFLATHNLFDVMGTQLELGRSFLPEEDLAGAPLVAILSHGTWTRRYGADSSIVGKTVRINQHPFTVVGVTEQGFRGPITIMEVGVWLGMGAAPVIFAERDQADRAESWVRPLARVREGVSREQVESVYNVVSSNLRAEFPENNPDLGIVVERYTSLSPRAMTGALAIATFLFLVSGTVLLIASINVGSMLLSRAERRGKEVALRLALGAGRGRVVRQLLAESILLFMLGASGAVLVTAYATRLLSTYQLPIDLPLVLDFSVDHRALAFSLAVALVAGTVFGLTPALQVTKQDLNTTLKADARSGRGPRRLLRGAFVVLQVSGSALLLVVAGLFARGLSQANSADLGFDPENVHFLSSEVDFHRNYTRQEAQQLFRGVLERAGALPEIEALALTNSPPVTLGSRSSAYAIAGSEPVLTEWPETDCATVSPGFFETLRIPIVQGRGFNEGDASGTPMVAIVNETFARRSWPGESPLGKRIRWGSPDGPELQVVGVARDAKYRSLGEEQRTHLYLAYEQFPHADLVLLARFTGDESVLASHLIEIVHDLDAELPIDANTAYEDIMGIALLPSRATALMTSIFGGLGLIMAAIGLYGVLAYNVTQRTREFGIRVALGAQTGDVRAAVVWEGIRLVAIGLVIGFGLAVVLAHSLRSLLFGISPADPLTLGGIALVLAFVAIGASYMPASRATRADPIAALRAE